MHLAVPTPKKATGSLLVGSFVVLLAAATYMVISGAVAGFPSMIQDRPYEARMFTADFRLLIGMFVLAWIIQLIGVGLLCHLLLRAGEAQLAIASFLLMLVSAWAAVLTYTFHMTVVLLVAGQSAQGDVLPPLYAPLLEWTRTLFGMGYYLYSLGVIGIGWAGLRSAVLGSWTGWVAIAAASLTIVGGVVDVGAPAVPLLAPVVIGVGLLLARERGQGVDHGLVLGEGF